ncbi:MAG: peptide chain release factor N(5)-glutamine methyltransferase [Bacteroidales bacterium]|nr:peptide chain release factor N(5)-glutamine methyltransferase [Bacteroidales bacterium]
MNFTLGDLRDLFISSLHTLYDKREAEAIVRYYFEIKWKIPAYEFAICPDKIFQNEEWLEMQKDLQRLQNGEPVQYVVGKSEFYGLTLQVNPLVLIPRPETEELVQLLLQHLSAHIAPPNCEDAVGYHDSSSNCKGAVGYHDSSFKCEDAAGHDATMPPAVKKNKVEHPTSPCRILDFCTGSGAIAIALAQHLPQAEVSATDYSRDILELAQKNAVDNHVPVNFILHDLLKEDSEKLGHDFQAIVSNPPYIPQSHQQQLHKNVKDYEPAEALFVPDEKPLLFYERIASMGRQLLSENGLLFFETHENYHDELESMLLQFHYHHIEKIKDLNGNPRFITCKK